MTFPTIVTIIAYAFAVLLVVAVIRSARRWSRVRRNRSKPPAALKRVCRCGYDLANLDIARCPECGRVDGFDATAADIGLTEEELRRVAEVRRQRERNER